ncbi:hypothetical protein ACLMAJ_12500 [Nocardia sp. KC 131]|uniref:hypothetical protein n=1 Tax=Nocardia arseniciresistens TaxID=3392119 RepID=UPI00398E6E55
MSKRSERTMNTAETTSDPLDRAAKSGSAGTRSAATSPDWAEVALGAVLDRAAVTYAAVGERFPLYADGPSGVWTTTSKGSWTGGFWAGLLWLRAGYTGSAADRSAAAAVTGRLACWVEADTSTRGLILWYGTAVAAASGEVGATRLRGEAARACLAGFDHELGVLPWGSVFGGERLSARVDGVPGVVPLLGSMADAGRVAARSHMDTQLRLWQTEPVGAPAWRRANGEWTPGLSPRAGWSRGRAWLLLALADAAWHLDMGYAAVAEQMVDTGLPLVPSAEAVPGCGALDTSAAAIEAVALFKLAAVQEFPEHAACLRGRAVEIVRCLVETYLSGPGGARPPGMLLNGCYDLDRGLATSHELIWGNYFLTLALAIHTGSVAPFDT